MSERRLLVAQVSNLRSVGKFARARRSQRGADWKSAIRQVGNLRYEQTAASHTGLRSVGKFARARRAQRGADWKSAIQQVGNLRYSRLEICATLKPNECSHH